MVPTTIMVPRIFRVEYSPPSQGGMWCVSEATEKEVLWGSWGRAMFQMLGVTEAGCGGCGVGWEGRRGSGEHTGGFLEPDSFKHPRSVWQLSALSIWALLEAPLVGRMYSRWELTASLG